MSKRTFYIDKLTIDTGISSPNYIDLTLQGSREDLYDLYNHAAATKGMITIEVPSPLVPSIANKMRAEATKALTDKILNGINSAAQSGSYNYGTYLDSRMPLVAQNELFKTLEDNGFRYSYEISVNKLSVTW